MISKSSNKTTSPSLPRHNKRNKTIEMFISHTCFASRSSSWRVLTVPSSAGRASSCFSRHSFNSACSLKFKELSSARYFFKRDYFNNWNIPCPVHTTFFQVKFKSIKLWSINKMDSSHLVLSDMEKSPIPGVVICIKHIKTLTLGSWIYLVEDFKDFKVLSQKSFLMFKNHLKQ